MPSSWRLGAARRGALLVIVADAVVLCLAVPRAVFGDYDFLLSTFIRALLSYLSNGDFAC